MTAADALLVVGLSGQVGEALLPRLRQAGRQVLALSRHHRPDTPGLRWLHGSLQAMPAQAGEAATVISLGPLDAFADWVERERPRARRIVALGSTGVRDKRASPDPAERELAARLATAEARLFAAARRTGAVATLLRPTLLYGSGRDRSLTPLVQRARRWRVLPLPSDARGLRQPVHVDEVADAVLACLDAPLAADQAFDLPGAEALPFLDMVRRTLRAQAPGSRVIPVPPWAFDAAVRWAGRLGAGGPGAGVRARLAQDQACDPGPAQAAFGYLPGPFRP